jgi:hypothetical protein
VLRRLPIAIACLVSLPGALAADLGEQRSPHFSFRYPALDAPTIAMTIQYLERERARVVDRYKIRDMPRVRVTFHTDHASLESAARDVAGGVPAWAFGVVTRPDEIHCMSPNLPEWGPYRRRLKDIVHEFVHAMTLHMNPEFANNPRWLWEAVALYEANQNVDLTVPPYLTQGSPPTLAELSRLADTRIYEVGYSIGEFIVKRWSHAKLRELVAESGDTERVLGVTLAQFESDWLAFVRKSYGL